MGEYGGVRPVGVFAGHRDGITFIDSRGDDRYLLTNSKDQTIKLWDMRHFSSDKAIESTKTAVGKQTWDYRWQCCPVENFKTAPLEGDSSVMTLRGHSVIHTLIRARFSPDYTGKRYIYSGCGRGNCIVHDIYTGETTKVYGGHRSVVRDCMWHPHFNELVTSSWDGETTIWRYDEREMRNINPESISNTPGDEDSCDESYKPVTTYKIDKKKMLKLKRPFCEENKMQ
jgi:WD repeat-containing protein 23